MGGPQGRRTLENRLEVGIRPFGRQVQGLPFRRYPDRPLRNPGALVRGGFLQATLGIDSSPLTGIR